MSTPAKGLPGTSEQTETKPGILTTEFWLTALLLILNNVEALPIPDKYSGWMNVFLPVAYLLSRGLAKQGVPNLEDDAPKLEAETPVADVADQQELTATEKTFQRP